MALTAERYAELTEQAKIFLFGGDLRLYLYTYCACPVRRCGENHDCLALQWYCALFFSALQ